jgi:hypothetical protein
MRKNQRRRLLAGSAATTVLFALLGGILLYNTDSIPEECADMSAIHYVEQQSSVSKFLKDIDCEEYDKGGNCVEDESRAWTPHDTPLELWGYNNVYLNENGTILPYNKARKYPDYFPGGGGGIRDRNKILDAKVCNVDEPHILLIMSIVLAGFVTVRWCR